MFGLTGARWRAVTREDTVNLSDACEVSCRVRVGEVTRPLVRSEFERSSRLHPKERLATPRMWVPRLCHAVSYDPWEVAELGVHLGASLEGEKRRRTYRNWGADVTSGSHLHRKSLRKVTSTSCLGDPEPPRIASPGSPVPEPASG